MISLDTSGIVRVVMKLDGLWLCKTVLLETEWVLRYSYKLGDDPRDGPRREP